MGKTGKRILIIDDDPLIRQLLKQILKTAGYEILEAEEGLTGIDIAKENLPDVILLDMIMPDLDGPVVCEILKSNELTRDIPVIFVTAKTELKDQVEGLKLGAQDYISKPVRPEVLIARVEAVMRTKQLQDQLKENIRLQKELSQVREHLMEQHMNSMVGQLAESLIHELNNPLAAVIGFAELIQELNIIKDEQVLGHLDLIKTMGMRASAKLSNILVIAKGDKRPGAINLNSVVSGVLELVNARLLAANVKLEIKLDEELPEVKGITHQLARAVLALVNNAIDVALDCEGSKRKIVVETAKLATEEIEVCIRDFGNNISAEISQQFFTPFFTTKGSEHAGLGLYLVKTISNEHCGKIVWQSDGEGSCFRLILPQY